MEPAIAHELAFKAQRPFLLMAHPRACSTVFERAFIQRQDIKNVHEPFDDAFFFGPERLHPRYKDNENARLRNVESETTYKVALDKILENQPQEKRVFSKGMARVIMPFNGGTPSIAPSLLTEEDLASMGKDASGEPHSVPYPYIPHFTEPSNPCVLPGRILRQMHFTFLIRHPRLSVPSSYRLYTPPISYKTGWNGYQPEDSGYSELRRLFDYLKETGQIGPKVATHDDKHNPHPTFETEEAVEICLVDADDLLDHPAAITEAYCRSVGLPYDESMLHWEEPEDRRRAESELGGNWMRPWHEVAIDSIGLGPRNQESKVKPSSESDYAKWIKEFGKDGADIVQRTVQANLEDYEYLKQFAMKVSCVDKA